MLNLRMKISRPRRAGMPVLLGIGVGSDPNVLGLAEGLAPCDPAGSGVCARAITQLVHSIVYAPTANRHGARRTTMLITAALICIRCGPAGWYVGALSIRHFANSHSFGHAFQVRLRHLALCFGQLCEAWQHVL